MRSREAVARAAVGAGLTTLVSVPLLTDRVRRRLLRRCYASLAREAGVFLSWRTLNQLTAAPSPSLGERATRLSRWPLRRLVARVTAPQLLMAKDALDALAEAALRGEMVARALEQGLLPRQVAAVRAAMDEALGDGRHSPLGRALLRAGTGSLDDWTADPDGLVAAVGRLLATGDGALVLQRFDAALKEAGAR